MKSASAASILAAGCLALAGCGTSGTGNARAVRHDGSPRGADPGRTGRPAPGRERPVTAFCPARPTTGLTAGLSRSVRASLRAEVVPLGVSASGGTGYVSTWTPAFSGVAALNLASGKLRPIFAFADPKTDQADGASGGRWLVWAQTYSLQNLDRFTIYAWDSVTGRLRVLGRSLSGPRGVPWPSPWHAPAVSGGHAAWAQGYGQGGLAEIRLADLATGRVQVIRKGHVQPPFFDGGLVVWPESDRPGAETSLRAFSLAAGARAPLPPVLRAVHGTEFVATDGTRTAYLSPGLTALYYSPAPAVRARIVLRLTAAVDFASLSMGAGSLAWTTTEATYLASTVTGAYARVTPAYGLAVTGQGTSVLVSDAPAGKALHPILALHVVTAAGIGAPACGR